MPWFSGKKKYVVNSRANNETVSEPRRERRPHPLLLRAESSKEDAEKESNSGETPNIDKLENGAKSSPPDLNQLELLENNTSSQNADGGVKFEVVEATIIKDAIIEEKSDDEDDAQSNGVNGNNDDRKLINYGDRRLTTEEIEEIKRRGGFRGDTIDVDQEIIKHPKATEEEVSIKEAIISNEFLNNVLQDDQQKLKSVIDAMSSRDVEKEEIIIKQGDSADYMFVSRTGMYEIIIDDKVENAFKDQRIFGELAILYNNVRLATIKAVTKGKLWMLHRNVYQQIVVKNAVAKEKETISFLKNVPTVQKASEIKLQKIANLLKTEFFKPDSVIIKQGDNGDKFYIIVAGTTSVFVEGVGKVKTLTRGEYFGELALLQDDVRQATVTAESSGVECLVLSRPDFIENLGDLNEFLAKEDSHQRHSSVPEFTSQYDHIKLIDLKRVQTLGIGAYGRVELVQHKKDENLVFALKYLQKQASLKLKDQVINEKNIQASCDSDFLTKLYKTDQDLKYLYFLLECGLGGDLFAFLQKQKGKCLDDNGAKFMAGCIMEALSYLHERGIVYRDLKPENILIDKQGYAKLADFGFAKKLAGGKKTYTFAGTPEYVAPEIVRNTGHDKGVDYWAFGIFIFELYTGTTPFRTPDNDLNKTFTLITKGINNVVLPDKIPSKAQSIIKKLCRQIPSERLGCQKNGAQDVINHKWFSNFDWQKLRDRKLKPPFVPKLSSNIDCKYFDKFEEETHYPADVHDSFGDF